MRQRDRFTGQVWLDEYRGDKRVPGGTPQEHMPLSSSDCLTVLGGQYRLVCEFRKDGDAYCLRVAPMVGNRESGRPWWAASYRGTSVRDLLRAAVADYDALCLDEAGGTWSPREVERWVVR